MRLSFLSFATFSLDPFCWDSSVGKYGDQATHRYTRILVRFWKGKGISLLHGIQMDSEIYPIGIRGYFLSSIATGV
jgi:hypothetical protein